VKCKNYTLLALSNIALITKLAVETEAVFVGHRTVTRVLNRGLYVCAGGLDILKFDKFD